MKKIVYYLIIGFLLVSCNQGNKNKIRIGVIAPLTGGAAIYGQAIKNGINLAYSESTIKDKVELIYEDNKGETKMGVSAMNKLVNSNVDIVIGGAMSSIAFAIAPISKAYKIPLLSPGGSSPKLDNAGKYFFRLWPSDTYDGKIMGELVTKRLSIKNIAVFYVNLEYGVGIKNVFEKTVIKNGGKIVYSDAYSQGATDFRSQLQKIKESNAKALFLPGYFAELSIILKQMKEMNMKIQILGTSSFHDKKLLDLDGDILEGAIFSFPSFDLNSKDTIIKKFSQRFFNKYKIKADIWAALGYDCYKVIEKTILNGATGPESIKNELYKIEDFPGVAGTFSFDKNGNVLKKLSILIIKNKKFYNF